MPGPDPRPGPCEMTPLGGVLPGRRVTTGGRVRLAFEGLEEPLQFVLDFPEPGLQLGPRTRGGGSGRSVAWLYLRGDLTNRPGAGRRFRRLQPDADARGALVPHAVLPVPRQRL